MCSRPLRWARVNHHWADEFLIKQHSVPDGDITRPIQEGTQHVHSWKGASRPTSKVICDCMDYVRREV